MKFRSIILRQFILSVQIVAPRPISFFYFVARRWVVVIQKSECGGGKLLSAQLAVFV